jgi:hypothetical protein
MESSIRVHNASDRVIEVWLEPWGDFVPLGAGAAIRVAATADAAGELEVVWRPSDVTVYAWPTASVRVFAADGAELKAGAFTVPVPAVPPGATVRSFLGLILGQ